MKVQENVLPMDLQERGIARPDRTIGAILIEEGRLTAREADKVAAAQEKEHLRFGEAALRLGLITEDDLRSAVAKQYDLPHLLPSNSSTISSELIAAYEPFHPRAEEMRALRTQLLIRWFNPGGRRRVLAVVSPGAGEGRSYVAANLAVVFSQIGERTLLIDADLRSPRQHTIFNVSDRIGLTAVLSGRADRNAIVPAPGFVGLSILPAGAVPPNPQELLSRMSFDTLLKEMQNRYDVIVVDTPPASAYADAQNIVFRAGSAIVIARQNHTRVDDTNRVMRDMADTGARVVGTVINNY
jgi:protein-tyrosine kinase